MKFGFKVFYAFFRLDREGVDGFSLLIFVCLKVFLVVCCVYGVFVRFVLL